MGGINHKCSCFDIFNESDPILSILRERREHLDVAFVAIMMASMAQPFGGHQAAMSGHAGVAHGGHPMSQGHPSNQGVPGGGQQPGVSMGQQMHSGVTGPGGPQVTQAGPMIPGMMQGGGPPGVSGGGVPSAHALSHLTTGPQGQVFAHSMQPASKQPFFTL